MTARFEVTITRHPVTRTALKRLFSQRRYHYAAYGAVFVLLLALAALASDGGYQLRTLEVRDYNLYRCDTGGDAALPVLRVLDAVYMEEMDLVDTWCFHPELARQFSAIHARRVHRDRVDLRDLYESRYDLVMAKQELFTGASAAGARGIGFVQIARYPDYGSQLVSLNGLPELSAQWLTGKRLGILDDPNSISGYQIPLAALKNRGLEKVPELVYMRTYRQMYKALFEGELDVIPAFLSQEGPDSLLQLPPGLVLEETLPGPAWYIHEDLADSPVHCALQRALAELSAEFPIDYFRELYFVRECPDA